MNAIAVVSHTAAHIILAGDLNQLPNKDVEERTGLKQVVQQPTRGEHILDRVYVSNPLQFSIIRVVKSVVSSDHKAFVAFPDLEAYLFHRSFPPEDFSDHMDGYLRY